MTREFVERKALLFSQQTLLSFEIIAILASANIKGLQRLYILLEISSITVV